ncbi:Gfo/Idh/MocA family protein [Sciscionella marina]|uniref:Gfo/Idh/MocA family protein n=1 Tax=Sciscionella marina TaxID=508770 RepID=UPI000365B26B|nr:Gfo/Idh/MocA family oxidoreductase [Sciscionella marina]
MGVPLRVGILGSGGIATVSYGVLPNTHHLADRVRITAIADVDAELAESVAAEYGIPNAYGSLEAMLADAELDAVLNLTPIPVHAQTSRTILDHGLHLVSEKPLAATMAEADELIATARETGRTVVCAPPDLLHEPYARAAELVRADAIGKVAFARVRSSHAGPGGGPKGWPSDPSWFYREGSGPLLDMGVYGIHEITGILGPARRVAAFAGITEPSRVVRAGPFQGLEMPVTAPDNCLFLLDFGESTFAVVDGTFNVHAARSPKVELFGRRGVLNLLTPDGPAVEVYRADAVPGVDGWIQPKLPLAADERRATYGRALLLAHLADVLLDDAPLVLSAEHARHALEIMLGVATSAREGRFVDLSTTF